MSSVTATIDTSQGTSNVSVETCNFEYFSAKGSSWTTDPTPQSVQFEWTFHEPNGKTTTRTGINTLHAWGQKGTYQVELTVTARYRIIGSSTPTGFAQTNSVTGSASTSVSVTGESYTKKLGSKSQNTLDRSAITEAKSRHDGYVEALDSFKNWKKTMATRKGVSQVELEQRIRLWKSIFDQIKRSRAVDGPPFADELWQKVGVTEDAFSDYEIDSTEWRERMGFDGKDPTPTLKEKTDKHVNNNAGEFLTFGRELLAAWFPVERNAADLVLWFKFGLNSKVGEVMEIPDPGEELKGKLKSALQSMEAGKSRRKIVDADVVEFRKTLARGHVGLPGNAFLAQLGAERYEEQVKDLGEVLHRLHESEIGLNFLGELFEFRDRSGTLDPLNLFSPHEFNDANKKLEHRGENYISTSTAGTKMSDVYSNGHLKYDTRTGAYEEKAAVVAQAGEKLVPPLMAGAMLYLSEESDLAARKNLVAQFGVLVRSAYFSDYGVQSLASKKSQFVQSLPAKAGSRSYANWTCSDHIDLINGILNPPSGIDVQSLWLGTETANRPDYFYQVKAAVCNYELGIATYEARDSNWSGTIDSNDLDKLQISAMGAIGVAFTTYEEYTEFWKEKIGPGYQLRVTNMKKNIIQKIGPDALGEFVEEVMFKKVTPWIDAIATMGELVKAGIAYAQEDHDYAGGLLVSAAGGGLVALGGAITANASGGSITVFWSAAAIPGGHLVILGMALIAAGSWIAYYEKDTEVGKWVQETLFGTEWNDGDYDDPDSLEYRFKEGESPNFVQQFRGYHEIAPKFDFTHTELHKDGSETTLDLEFSSRPTGRGLSVVKGGAIYLRALVHHNGDQVPFPWLHKIGVGEWLDPQQQAPGRPTMRLAMYPNHLRRNLQLFQGNATQHSARVAKLAFGGWMKTNYPSQLPPVYQWRKKTWESNAVNPQMVVGYNVNSVTFDGDTMTELDITLSTMFPPLLTGVVPKYLGQRTIEWPTTTLEAVYLPPVLVEKLEGDNPRGIAADVNKEFAIDAVETALASFAPLRGPSGGEPKGDEETPTVSISQSVAPDWRWEE